jgi:hypothetical protein
MRRSIGEELYPVTAREFSIRTPPARKRLLVIGEEKGYRHEAVTHAMVTIERLGHDTGGWDTVIRTDCGSFAVTGQERGPVQYNGDRRAWSNLWNEKALAICRNVIGPRITGAKPCGEKLLRHAGGKPLCRVYGGRHHCSIRCEEEKFLAVAAPPRSPASIA